MDSPSDKKEPDVLTAEQLAKKEKKKAKEAAKKRMMTEKKFEQGTETLEKMEGKKLEEIVSNEPTPQIIFIYFGVGSQQDCYDLEAFLEAHQYKDGLFDMFPGFPHGFLEFESQENCTNFMKTLDEFEFKGFKAGFSEIKFKSKPKLGFFFYSKLTKKNMNESHGNDLPNASTTSKVPGIILIENFMTEEEEKKIFQEIDKREWHKLATRRVQHDGYEFIYGENNVNPNNRLGDLPDWIHPMQKKLEAETDKVNGEGVGLDQLTINDYNPGDGIPPHVDAIGPFETSFGAISMGSGAVMNFRHPDGRQENIYYPPRSAVIFTGEGRMVWQHSIACRKLDRIDGKLKFRTRRVSLTFRKVRKLKPGEKHIMSDSKGKKIDYLLSGKEDKYLKEEMEKSKNSELPTNIEKTYVYDVYNKIAPHFSSTRYKPWPQVVKYLDELPDNSFVADVGCGNGKYLTYNSFEGSQKKHIFVGTDIAENLLKICRSKSCEVFTADSLTLPIKSECFDHAISIAVLHHFSNDSQRRRALSELLRIIKKGGTVLATVWAFEQNKKFPKQDLFVPWNLQDNFHKKNVSQGIENPAEIGEKDPEKELPEVPADSEKFPIAQEGLGAYHDSDKQAVVYKRYYHLFMKGEMDRLVGEVGGEILDTFYNRDNWCVKIGKK